MAYLAIDTENTTSTQLIVRVYGLDESYEFDDRTLYATITVPSGGKTSIESKIAANASYSKGVGVTVRTGEEYLAEGNYNFNIVIKTESEIFIEFNETFYYDPIEYCNTEIGYFSAQQKTPFNNKTTECSWRLSDVITGKATYRIYAYGNGSWILKTAGIVNSTVGNALITVDEFREYELMLKILYDSSTAAQAETTTNVIPDNPEIYNFSCATQNGSITITANFENIVTGITQAETTVKKFNKDSNSEYIYESVIYNSSINAEDSFNITVPVSQSGYYEVSIMIYTPTATTNYTYSDFEISDKIYVTVNTAPEPWDWNKTEDRKTAYAALISKGKVTDFYYIVWNEFVEKVKAVAKYRGYSDNKCAQSEKTFEELLNESLIYANDKTLKAQIYNNVLKCIKSMNPTLTITEKSTGEKVLGIYITELAEKLNSVIS